MFRRGLEITHFCLHAEERRDGGADSQLVPTFRLSARKSSDHFEKRKLGRVVSKLSLVDQLGILEEVEDDLNTEDEKVKTSKLEHQDSGISVLSLEVSNILHGDIATIIDYMVFIDLRAVGSMCYRALRKYFILVGYYKIGHSQGLSLHLFLQLTQKYAENNILMHFSTRGIKAGDRTGQCISSQYNREQPLAQYLYQL